MDWYEENIEPGIRDAVRLLRDNGVNTQCSCEHDRYIECQFPMDDDLMRIDYLLFNNGYRNYIFKVEIIRENGHLRTTLCIEFTDYVQV